MTAPATTVLTVRLPAEIKERLSALAKMTSTSQSTLASEAIAAFVEDQERQLAKIREGIADAEAGRVVEHEDVARWLDSWGTDDEQRAFERLRKPGKRWTLNELGSTLTNGYRRRTPRAMARFKCSPPRQRQHR